jgi:hypothetical protein
MRKFVLSIVFPMLFLELFSFHAFAQTDENVFRNATNVKANLNSESIMDEDINFNANWKFQLGELPGFYVLGYNDNNWRTLDVPHDWSVELPYDSTENVAQGYRKRGFG